ncbi:DUF4129 domain-containing protein [Chloroflexus sp.]|uniref:DUF4129 domain-containing protein n=1 Tax=Chloroflexus sp. TaxID=1904827 RepID=UPI0026351D16|nr:DUF4129 domain-containing protein [uncultured Chloroflexus sp.]
MTQPSLLGPAFIIAILITLPLTMLSERVSAHTDWQSIWLSGASVLVSLEAIALRSRMVAGLHETHGGAARYLAAEVFGLVALARIVATLGQGMNGITAIATWIPDPLAAFDVPFLFCLFALLFVAILSRSGIAAIAALTPNPPLKTPLQSLDLLFYRSDAVARRQAAVDAISRGVIWGGLVMALSFDPQQIPSGLGWTATGIMAIYLGGGLILIMLAQQRARLADWQSEEAEISSDLNRHWSRISIVVIGLIILFAVSLPGQQISLIPAEWRETMLVLASIILLITLILALFFIGLASLIALLPLLLLMLLDRFQNSDIAPAQPLQPPAIAAPPESEPFIWAGIIFWICMLLLVGLAFWTIIRRQEWMHNVADQFQHWSEQFVMALRKWRFGRWRYRRKPVANQRRQPTTKQVRLTDIAITSYHTALREAARYGYRRYPSQTPAEFAAMITKQLPEGSPELEALTEAYHRAAYARRSTDRKEWRQLGTWLRQFRRRLAQAIADSR